MTGSRILETGGVERVLNAAPDITDLRDRMFEPTLRELRVALDPPPPEDIHILNQMSEGACTGFALAAAINLQNRRRRGGAPEWVSPRMLYEMARIHDEWAGEAYEGSSIRGAIKGFFHNGVCSEELAPYDPNDRKWSLTVEQAKAARNVGLGAYFRLRPHMIDYHSALNEAGVIVASARVHRGWSNPREGVIEQTSFHEGGHAFAIVGYDAVGFLIQNSWGPDWGGFNGRAGIAHWSYGDWAESVIDAWVLRPAVPTPKAFDLTHVPAEYSTSGQKESFLRPTPRRQDVAGHLIHIDDGRLVKTGRYATGMGAILETARLIRDHASARERKYDHLLVYAHGGLNGADASARRIAAMREVFKRNGIYPVHLMWETGFTEELADTFKSVFERSKARVGFSLDVLDRAFERMLRGIGRMVWRQMKLDAARAVALSNESADAIKALLDANTSAKRPLKVHFAGHSAGSILLGELLNALPGLGYRGRVVETCSLMAPACTIDFYESTYRPALDKDGALASLVQYNLVDSREQRDTVGPYRKSLLYLVARAFEDTEDDAPPPKHGQPLLGMEIHSEMLERPKSHQIWYAGRDATRTDSHSHGGFDNDRKTTNDVLATVLGRKPNLNTRFQEHELRGY